MFEKSRGLKIFSKTCFIALLLTAAAYVPALGQTSGAGITLSCQNEKLSDALKKVELMSDYKIIFSYNDIGNLRVSADIKDASVTSAIKTLLEGQPLSYTIDNKYVRIFADKKKALSKKGCFSGKVVDENGDGMPGVHIRSDNGRLATVSNDDGTFSILAERLSSADFTFTFIGMKTTERTLKNGVGETVVMKDAVNSIDEVVVTGYQQLNKREMASAVSVIKEEDIHLNGTLSIDQMLAGQVAGMSVTQTSGSPTATPKIRIRGTSSVIGNKAPLWVLDGVVLSDAVDVDHSDLTGEDAVYLVGNAIAGINPSDIESITILKDASATAIYGVQAANGVIVVTTKKGKSGKARIDYGSSLTFSQRENYSRLNLMSATERIELSKEIQAAGLHYPRQTYSIGYEGLYYKYANKTITKDEYDKQLNYLESNNTDWFKVLFRNAATFSNHASVSGGNDQTTYYTSLGADDIQGTARKEKTHRYTMTAKLDSWLFPRLFVSMQLNASQSHNNGYNTSATSPRSWAYNTSRAIPCYNSDGSLFFYTPYVSYSSAYDDLQRNYLYELDNTGNKSTNTSLTARLSVTWKILDYLKYEFQGSYAYTENTREQWASEKSYYISKIRGWSNSYDVTVGSYEWENSVLPQGGIYTRGENSSGAYNMRNQLTFSKMIKDDHLISIVGISEVRSDDRRGFSGTYYGYFPERGYIFSPSLTSKYVSKTLPGLAPTKTVSTINTASFRGIGTYSYKDKYTLNANISMDGSNQFGSNPKYRFLPIWSVAGKWTLSQEDFLKGNKTISYLALRSSYGLQGNVDSNTSPDLVLQIGEIDSKTGLPLSTVRYYPNKDLRWEKTQSYNIGVDFSLWNDLLSGTIDVYNKKGSDLLMSKTISAVNGMESLTINAGNLRNSGIETAIKVQPINTRDWTAYGEIIYSYNNNKLLSANSDKDITYSDKVAGSALIVGEALGTLYSYDFAGLNHDTGLPVFRDASGKTSFTKVINGKTVEVPNYTILSTEVGLVKSGKLTAPTTGSINFGLRYKSWRINASFLYTLGGVARLPSIYNNVYKTFDPEYNVSRELLNRWRKPGDEEKTNIPVLYDDYTYSNLYDAGYFKTATGATRLYGYSMYDYSSARVCSTDNLRMRSLTAAYRLPEKILKRIKSTDASVQIQFTNLFLIANSRWHGCDPELGQSATSSIPRTVSVGLNIRF
jgi:TonB-linked SusC/RagA family outer membrane protein